MKKLMMVLGLVCLTSPAFANKCKVTIEDDSYVFKVKEGSSLRNMTYREMFDFMNDSGKPAAEILSIVNSALIEHTDADGDTRRISELRSVPKREKGDRACKKELRHLTGYECRDIQLREKFGAEEGIETEAFISIPKSEKDAILNLAGAFKCSLQKVVESAAPAKKSSWDDAGPAPADEPAPYDRPAPSVKRPAPAAAAPAPTSQVAQLANRPRSFGPNHNARPRIEDHPLAVDVLEGRAIPASWVQRSGGEVHPLAEDVLSGRVVPESRVMVDTTVRRGSR